MNDCVNHEPVSMHERLRVTALELFCKNGYQSTSMRDLATHLGIQAGSLYNHMKSKQGLLFELIEGVLEDLLAESRYRMRKQGSFDRKLHTFIETYVEFSASERESLALLEREANNLSDLQRARVAELRTEYMACLSGLIASEPAFVGMSASSLGMLVQTVVGMLQGLMRWQECDLATSRAEWIESLERTIRAAMAAAVSAPSRGRSRGGDHRHGIAR
ncbi:HTH-type transcriptional repressor KstR2 [compost metagenome]